MERVGVAVVHGVRVCAVTVCRSSLVPVIVVLAVMRCRADLGPAIGADRCQTELQRDAQQEKDR